MTQVSAADAQPPVPVLSIVIPVFNEEGNISEIYSRVKKVVEGLGVSFEMVFVDDGSKDRSWQILQELKQTDDRVHGLRFSRNFGHQIALRAGIDAARGDAVITMDCDLQHPPAMIADLYRLWAVEGYDIVNTAKTDAIGHSPWRKLTMKLGYWVINKFVNIAMEPGMADFRLMSRRVCDKIRAMPERHLLLRGIVSWLGYKSTVIPYVAEARFSGQTKYSFRRLALLVLWGVMSFSGTPLRVFVYAGFIMSFASLAYSAALIIMWASAQIAIPGWTTTTFLILFFGGINLMGLGFIGEYIAKIYEEIKQRPKYIITEES